MREAAIHQAVIDHWRKLGLPNTLVATIPNMRAAGQAGLTAGLPDLIVFGPGLPIGLIELKNETGTIKPEQKMIGDLCRLIGAKYALTRGRDEPIRLLEDWQIVRRTA